MQHRAYSVLNIKAVDEESRTITGIASTPTTDRMDDIVEPKGAQFKLPIPFLWQHRHSEPIGHVTAAKITDAGISVTVQLAKIDEPGTLRDRLDEAWQSIKLGLVRGLSIGFSPIESASIDGTWGYRFLKWEWLELSAVTIPANAEANIQTVKSFDRQQRAASGQSLLPVVHLKKPAGASATKNKSISDTKPVEGSYMNIQEQIKNFEASRQAKAQALHAVQQKAIDEGRSKDAAEQEEFDTLNSEIISIDKELGDLRQLEKVSVAKATPVVDTTGANKGIPAVAKVTQKLDKGIEFARYAMCQLAAKGNPDLALRLAKAHYPQNERIVKALQFESERGRMEPYMKAAVEAGTTLDSTWAGPLVDYQNFAGDFVEFLRPQTIIGQFGTGNIPALNRIPFNVRIGGQTSGGTGYWVGEGAPKPLTSFDFNATELRWNKVATIAVLTEETIRFSNPSAERLVRDGLAAAIIGRMDLDFVDPAKAAVSNVSPASITNGATSIASTGVTADDIRSDIKALWAPFIAARNPPRTAVYIMDSTTALALSMMQNPLGQSEFPGLTMNGGMFLGVPAVVSDYLPVDSDGGIIVLVNARDIWLADDEQVTIDASREASLQMLDNPTNNSATGTATSMVSMFQTNSVAFRAERYINWARRRASGVAYLTGVNYGEA
jgi:HK97 family phage major capsid protein/HK97 family phage prohead protease